MQRYIKLKPSRDRRMADFVSLAKLKNMYFYLNLRSEKGFPQFKKKALQLPGAELVNTFNSTFWLFKDEGALLALFCEKFPCVKSFETLGALRSYLDQFSPEGKYDETPTPSFHDFMKT